MSNVSLPPLSASVTINLFFMYGGLFLFEATWMDLEIIIPSEISQTEKDKYYMILLM